MAQELTDDVNSMMTLPFFRTGGGQDTINMRSVESNVCAEKGAALSRTNINTLELVCSGSSMSPSHKSPKMNN